MPPEAVDDALHASLAAEYGGDLLPFVREGFDGAVRRSAQLNRPLFLYLHDPHSEVRRRRCAWRAGLACRNRCAPRRSKPDRV